MMGDRILVLDRDETVRDALQIHLDSAGDEVVCTSSVAAAERALTAMPFDLVLCELEGPSNGSSDVGASIRALSPRLAGATLVALTRAGAVEPDAARAYDQLCKPFDTCELERVLGRARERARLRRENRRLRRQVEAMSGELPIVASSAEMIALLEALEQAAPFPTPVLFHGERGTGKEVLARALHAQSPRRAGPFVRISAAAESDLERALFGDARSTGRSETARMGMLVEAGGGTLLLDDVDRLPAALQAKLVAVLQDESVQAFGAAKPHPVDVRILASTPGDLQTAVAEGRFREDLFLRLAGIQLRVPALRERRTDIPLLVDLFMAQCRQALGKDVRGVADDALERLVAHRWNGNVRELANVVEGAMILAPGDRISLRDLPHAIAHPESGSVSGDENLGLRRARRALEVELIRRALRATDGNRTHAARRLEISHRALLYKLKEYGIRD